MLQSEEWELQDKVLAANADFSRNLAQRMLKVLLEFTMNENVDSALTSFIIDKADWAFEDLEFYMDDPTVGIYGYKDIQNDVIRLRQSNKLLVPVSEICVDCLVLHKDKCPLQVDEDEMER